MNNTDELLDVKDHLNELKKRFLICLGFFVIAFVVFYNFSDEILTFITKAGKDIGYDFIFISPAEILLQQLRIAAIIGLALVFPIVIYEISAFIRPATNHSILNVFAFIFSVSLMFIIGVIFAYNVIIPFIFNMFYEAGIESQITAQISIQKFIDLYLGLNIALGVVFELPLAVFILSKLSLVTPQMLIKFQGPMVFLSTVIGMVLTPPDVFSQILVAIPIIVLYEISILICKLTYKKA